MVDARAAAQVEKGTKISSKFAGRELADKLEGAKKKQTERKGGKSLVETAVKGLETRIKLEAITPTLKGFSEAVDATRGNLGEAAERLTKAIDAITALDANSTLDVQKATLAEYTTAKSAYKSTETRVTIDLSTGGDLDKKAVDGWQKSKGGKDLKDYARENFLDVTEIKYKGIGKDGVDVVELVVDNGKVGTGKVRSRNASPAETEIKRGALAGGAEPTPAQ